MNIKNCKICRRVTYGESLDSVEFDLHCTRIKKDVTKKDGCKYFKRNPIEALSNGIAKFHEDENGYTHIYKRGKFLQFVNEY